MGSDAFPAHRRVKLTGASNTVTAGLVKCLPREPLLELVRNLQSPACQETAMVASGLRPASAAPIPRHRKQACERGGCRVDNGRARALVFRARLRLSGAA